MTTMTDFHEKYPESCLQLSTRHSPVPGEGATTLQWIDGPSVEEMLAYDFTKDLAFDKVSRALSFPYRLLGYALIQAGELKLPASKLSARKLAMLGSGSNINVVFARPTNSIPQFKEPVADTFMSTPLCDTLRNWSRDKSSSDMKSSVTQDIHDRVEVLQALISESAPSLNSLSELLGGQLEGSAREMQFQLELRQVQQHWEAAGLVLRTHGASS